MEKTSLGQHRVRWFATSHLPQAWECGFLAEETTRTLLCGDLFSQGGAQHLPLTEADILEPSEAFRRQMDYYSHPKTLPRCSNGWRRPGPRPWHVCTARLGAATGRNCCELWANGWSRLWSSHGSRPRPIEHHPEQHTGLCRVALKPLWWPLAPSGKQPIGAITGESEGFAQSAGVPRLHWAAHA
jgi:hypothetical protein